MITLIWIALAIAVLGSIQLIARAATSERAAVKVRERSVRASRR